MKSLLYEEDWEVARPAVLVRYNSFIHFDAMRHYPSVLLTISALAIISIPLPVNALPFKKNCASMQQYFNSWRWGNSTKFSGFENQKPSFIGINISCDGGYITETSPMGTRVCEGDITYSPQAEIKGRWSSSTQFGQQCRWR